jgi:hypothetical protein
MEHPVVAAMGRGGLAEENLMSWSAEAPDHPVTELLWVGDGAWVACDPALEEGDPRRVIAYLECKDRCVRVQWVRDRLDLCVYETLREALQEVDASCRESVGTGV